MKCEGANHPRKCQCALTARPDRTSMSPLSLEQFEQLLLSTGLVNPDQLQAALGHIHRRTGGAPADCLTLARQLGRMGLITAWQNHKLLSGDVDGYFFGSCKLLAHMHTGLTGEVYHASRAAKQDATLALKVLAPPWSTSHQQLPELRDQVQQSAELEHPHLVRMWPLETAGALVAIVSEWIDGAAVNRRISGERALDTLRAAQIIRQVAAALCALHESGLVHGRLCPSKVVLDTHEHVKLLDPGLSVLAEVALTEQFNGRATDLIDCVAPEQAINPACMTPGVDLYALGCCLYTLLCGKVPYPDGDFNQRLFARQQGSPPDIRKLRPDTPPELATLCRELLCRRPQDRPPSAEAIVSELDGYLRRIDDADAQGWGEGTGDDSGLTQMVGQDSAIDDEEARITVDPQTGRSEGLSDSHVLKGVPPSEDDDASDTFIGKHDSALVEAVSLEVAGEEDNGSGVMDELEFPDVDDPNTPTTLASMSQITRQDDEVKLITREDKARAGESSTKEPPQAEEDWSDSDIEGPEPRQDKYEVTEDSEFALDELGSGGDSGTLTASNSAIRRAGHQGVYLETAEDSDALAASEAADEDATPEIYTELEKIGGDSGTVTGSLSDIKRAGGDAVSLQTGGETPELVPPTSTTPYDSGPIVISQELDDVGQHGGTVTGSLSDIKRAGEDGITMSTPEEGASLIPPPAADDTGPMVISQELNDLGQYGGTITGSLSDIKRAGEDPISMELAGEVAVPPPAPADNSTPIVIGQELNEVANYTGTVIGSLSDITRAGDESVFLQTTEDAAATFDPGGMALPEIDPESSGFSDLVDDEQAVCLETDDASAPVAEIAPPSGPVPLHTAGDAGSVHFETSPSDAETPTEIRTRAKMNEMLQSFGEDSGPELPRVPPADESMAPDSSTPNLAHGTSRPMDPAFESMETASEREPLSRIVDKATGEIEALPWDEPSMDEAPGDADEGPIDEEADTLDLPGTTSDISEPAVAGPEVPESEEPEEPKSQPVALDEPISVPVSLRPKAPPTRPAGRQPTAPRPASRRPQAPAADRPLALSDGGAQTALAMTWGMRAAAAFGLFAILTIIGFLVTGISAGVVNLAGRLSELLLVFGTIGVLCLAVGIAARPHYGPPSKRRN